MATNAEQCVTEEDLVRWEADITEGYSHKWPSGDDVCRLIQTVRELRERAEASERDHAGTIDANARLGEAAFRLTAEKERLRAENASLQRDRERLDWLEGEYKLEQGIPAWKLPRSLFRRNNPITRSAIDAAISCHREAGNE